MNDAGTAAPDALAHTHLKTAPKRLDIQSQVANRPVEDRVSAVVDGEANGLDRGRRIRITRFEYFGQRTEPRHRRRSALKNGLTFCGSTEVCDAFDIDIDLGKRLSAVERGRIAQ